MNRFWMDIFSDAATFLMLCVLYYWCTLFPKPNTVVNHQDDNKVYTQRPFIMKYFAVLIVVLYGFVIVMKIILNG
jgi:hypothetical protein